MKPTKSAVAKMPDANLELPYEGAKEMLLVDDVENKEFLRGLLEGYGCQTANCERRFRRIIFDEIFDHTAISSRRMQAVSGDAAIFQRRQERGSRLYFSRGISSFEIRPRESRSLI